MSVSTTLLVAHPDRAVGHKIEAGLFEAGFEAICVQHPEEVLRNAVGSNPSLILISDTMPQLGGYELHRRLLATGLEIPTIIVFDVHDGRFPEEAPPEGVFVVPTERSDPEALVAGIRLLDFSRSIEGEFGLGLDRMHGDLGRVAFGGLIQGLRKHLMTGRVVFSASVQSGLLLREGVVVDTWRGNTRGLKAFNRLAGLPGGVFSFSLEEVDGEPFYEGDIGELVLEAVEERVELADLLDELPPLDSVPGVEVTPDFFSLEFSRTEKQILAKAQEVGSFGDLVDSVDAGDLEVIRGVQRLIASGVLKFRKIAGKVHVITDSTADIMPAEAREQGITLAPVSVQMGSDVFKDGIDLDAESFYRRFEKLKELPMTHPVSEGEFRNLFRREIGTGDIVAVICSSKLSGSFKNAEKAVVSGWEEFAEVRRDEGRLKSEAVIKLVDSRQCSAPLGMMASFARRMAWAGLRAEEIARRLEEMKGRFSTVLMVRSISFLERSQGIKVDHQGRGGRGRRWLLRLEEGQLRLIDTVEGIDPVAKLLGRLIEGIDPGRPVLASLVQASAPADAAQLRDRLLARLNLRELGDHQLGPAVTSHTGPGTVGAGLFQPTEEELEILAPKS